MSKNDPGTTPAPTPEPTVDDYLQRADELLENGHPGGAAALYDIAGFPAIADMLRDQPDVVDTKE